MYCTNAKLELTHCFQKLVMTTRICLLYHVSILYFLFIYSQRIKFNGTIYSLCENPSRLFSKTKLSARLTADPPDFALIKADLQKAAKSRF